ARLKRHDEAAAVLRQVSNERGSRWPAWASCQLWLILVQQRQLVEADAVFALLTTHYSAEQLAVLIPADIREAIFEAYRRESTCANLMMYINRPDRARRLEQVIAIQELLTNDVGRLALVKHSLSRAFRAAGDND